MECIGCSSCKCVDKILVQSCDYTKRVVKSIDDLIPIPSSLGAPVYIVLDTARFCAQLTLDVLDMF